MDLALNTAARSGEWRVESGEWRCLKTNFHKQSRNTKLDTKN